MSLGYGPKTAQWCVSLSIACRRSDQVKVTPAAQIRTHKDLIRCFVYLMYLFSCHVNFVNWLWNEKSGLSQFLWLKVTDPFHFERDTRAADKRIVKLLNIFGWKNDSTEEKKTRFPIKICFVLFAFIPRCLMFTQFEIWHAESETSYGGNGSSRKKQTSSLLVFLSLFFNAI